ncbi:uncharacterized protein LOC132723495 [Ruditapes philippinarum]|uniref:uncharacterized protein LOC132723495 n=1 Tax=Ruditapes philippinarum TaxID=129788 RepID=UPI00295C2F0A|nr:uncharacterized protein LOC132723495 [Ruditapes philippinarum]
MLNHVVVENYFNDLGKIIQDLNLSSINIWNCDETGLNFEHCPVNVIAERGTTVVSKTSQKSSNLTIMACVNAAGDAMPPLIITKGKTVKSLHGFKTIDAPKDTVWSYQEKGWITDEIGERWFNQVFIKQCGPKRPQLLVFDDHSSHETLAIIERAIEENIILLSLPPHTTHYLQPLDRSVFGPFKKAYNEKCSEFISEHPLHVVNKHSFPSLLTKAWDDAFTQSNVKSGFASCGIWPVNRFAIPNDAFMPSSVTDVPHVTHTLAGFDATSTPTVGTYNAEDSSEVMTAVPLSPQLENRDEEPSRADDVPLPVLDLSDPAVLLELISSENLIMDRVDDNAFNEVSVETALDVDNSISEVFLPPKLESRKETKNNVAKKTSHTILTSEEIVKQKREIQKRKNEKETKKAAKRIKTEKN